MEQIYSQIDKAILLLRTARKSDNYFMLMEVGMGMLEMLPALIDESTKQEHEYRKYEAKLANEVDTAGKKNTSSYSETQAKATENYSAWRKANMTIDFVYEVVNMSKKLAGTVIKDETNNI